MNIKNDNTLGENIMLYRTSRGMTKSELADKLNISVETLTRYENNTSIPSHETLALMAAEFNVSVNMLLRSFNDPIKERRQKNHGI